MLSRIFEAIFEAVQNTAARVLNSTLSIKVKKKYYKREIKL